MRELVISDAFNPRRGLVGITAMLAAKLLKEITAKMPGRVDLQDEGWIYYVSRLGLV